MASPEKWDKEDKDTTDRFSSDGTRYSSSYPYLPKKVTIALAAVAILMFVGIVNNLINPFSTNTPYNRTNRSNELF